MNNQTDPNYAELLKRALSTINKLENKVKSLEEKETAPIAIIGVGNRLPGGVNDAEMFWDLLRRGENTIIDIPPERFDVDAIFDDSEDRAPNTVYSRKASLVDDFDEFDPLFFGIAPREANTMDPQQRLFLEAVWQAFEHAGIAPDDIYQSKTGVFVGAGFNEYGFHSVRYDEIIEKDLYYTTGIHASVVSGRVSYLLGLHGPSLTVDTACSSSLQAVHLACRSLRSGESDMAVAGGVNLILDPAPMIGLAKARMLAADGQSKTFDAAANGYVRGEGSGAVILKRLADAERDGDRVLAVLLGTASNQDGRSNGLTAPSSVAQEMVIRSAMANAGIEPDQINYVEAHGTGTSLGDPLETQALATIFGDRSDTEDKIILGAVKTNVGHLEAAAGITSLIKTVLAIQHQKVPQNLHFNQPNPDIPWDRLPFTVPTELTPWQPPNEKRRIAGINSFGFSGTNVHVIVAEPESVAADDKVRMPQRSRQVIPLSAKSEAALRALATRYRDFLAEIPADEPATAVAFADAAYTAAVGRNHYKQRLAVVGDTPAAARDALAQWLAGEETADVISGSVSGNDAGPLVMMFTGQGSQAVNMGRDLYETEPVFRAAVDRCASQLDQELDIPLRDILYPDDAVGERKAAHWISQTSYTQPALFAIEYALAELWKSWGVEPAMMIGHSVGEYVAAVQAGVFSLEDGLRLIAARGRLMQALPEGGAMAAILTAADRVDAAVSRYPGRVSIAGYNGPTNIVISGEGEAVTEIVRLFSEAGVRTVPLNVSHAFHSPLMDPMLEAFRAVAATISFHEPQKWIMSNVTGELADGRMATPDYWVDHVRNAVRFEPAVKRLHQQGYDLFLEAGPRPTLSGMGRWCVPNGAVRWLHSLHPDKADWAVMGRAIGGLYAAGGHFDWRAFTAAEARARVSVPTYPFQRQKYWYPFSETLVAAQQRTMMRKLRPLVGQKIESPQINGIVYETQVNQSNPGYLDGHRILELPLFPGTGFVEMASEAAQLLFGNETHTVELHVREALLLSENEMQKVQISAQMAGTDTATFKISGLRDETWTVHAEGRLIAGQADGDPRLIDLDEIRDRCLTKWHHDEFYEFMEGEGYNHRDVFAPVQEAHIGELEVIVRSQLPAGATRDIGDYVLHPALLDSALQASAIINPKHKGAFYLPVTFGRVYVYETGVTDCWAYVTTKPMTPEILESEIQIIADDGRLIAEVVGARYALARHQLIRQLVKHSYKDWFFEIDWERQTVDMDITDVAVDSGRWLVFGDESAATADVVGRLSAQGQSTQVITVGNSLALDSDRWMIDPANPAHMKQAIAQWLAEDAMSHAGVVYLWGFDAALPQRDGNAIADHHAATAGLLHLAQSFLTGSNKLLDAQSGPRIYVLTRAAQFAGDTFVRAPIGHALWALGRTMALEHPELRVHCVDVDDGTDLGETVWQELHLNDRENQVAVRQDGRYLARLENVPAESLSTAGLDAYALTFTSRGVLDNLEISAFERGEPGPNEVEIKIRATGLNFRDVLNVLGMYPGDPGPIGGECAGTIVRVGDGVTGFNVGDEVIAASNDTFRSHIIAPVHEIFHKPANLSPAQAATIPITFMTAHYGLNRIANMKAGDKVLIHAAAGGVGMAAVQLAKLAGAEIFGTAGSPHKRQLLKEMGVHHVMHSRTLDFADEIMEITNGEGVNIILNSLADEFIPKSLSVLADDGYFLEIGKRGIWSDEQVAELNPTLHNHVYDLAQIMRDEPDFTREMMDYLLGAFADGRLDIPPLQAFPIQDAISAFRYMAQAKHVGKIVVTQTHGNIEPEATYLVTGGLGGVGLQVTRWLVNQGATHLVLTSRRGPNPEKQEILDELGQFGATIEVIKGDVSQPGDVSQILAQIQDHMPPLRGILHLAGVLDDGGLLFQDWSRFETVMRPKVTGTWHLHNATYGCGLDFFVMFSSVSNIFGNPGQSNYAVANAFMDGLAAYRQYQGLPALSINWGAWGEVGMAAETEAAVMAAVGLQFMIPSEAVQALGQAMQQGKPQMTVMLANWPQLLSREAGVPLFERLAQKIQQAPPVEDGQGDGDSAFLVVMQDTPLANRLDVLLEHVVEQIIKVLGLDQSHTLDTKLGLFELGMDSLTAVELSNRLQGSLGITLPPTLAFETPTIEAMVVFLLDELFPADEESTEPEHTPAVDILSEEQLEAEIDKLSEDEALDSLLDELEETGY